MADSRAMSSARTVATNESKPCLEVMIYPTGTNVPLIKTALRPTPAPTKLVDTAENFNVALTNDITLYLREIILIALTLKL